MAIAGVASLSAAGPTPRLNVCLVAGTDRPAYDATHSLQKLAEFLEHHYGMNCVVIWPEENGEDFKNIAALRTADVGVFLVRRKTPPSQTLTQLKDFFLNSGKGVVALGPTSHAWENWPSFDADVLGAAYARMWEEAKPVESVTLRAHPIMTGAADFTTSQAVYAYTDLADDVQVLMEAGLEGKSTPIAWTREQNGRRLFYIAPARTAEFDKQSYLRIIGNSILWSARQEIPGSGTRVQRTWMADAYPSSFAVGFPSGLNFCFDPVRANVIYAWDGDYVDLWPTISGKFPRDAEIQGTLFYKAAQETPFRTGNRAEKPEIQFKGYALSDGIPEFQYEVDGVPVRESIRPAPDRSGLVREFSVSVPDRAVSFHPSNPSRVSIESGPANWDGDELRLSSNSTVVFSEFLPRQ